MGPASYDRRRRRRLVPAQQFPDDGGFAEEELRNAPVPIRLTDIRRPPEVCYGYDVGPPSACLGEVCALYQFARRSRNKFDDAEAILRAQQTHVLMAEYIRANYYVHRYWNSKPRKLGFEVRRCPSPSAVYRRLERAIHSDDFDAWHRAWGALCVRGKELLEEAFYCEFKCQDWHPSELLLPLFDRERPWRCPLLLPSGDSLLPWCGDHEHDHYTPPKNILRAAIERTIKLNSSRRRPAAVEQDRAAAHVVASVFYLSGETVQQPQHVAGSSRRTGTIVRFTSEVERIYGVPLIGTNSGAAWARIIKLVPPLIRGFR
jgi:hypothetical protein